MAELEAAILDQQVRISNRDPYACLFKPDEAFDPETLKLRDRAYQLIAPLVEHHYAELFDPERRGVLIAEESANQGISKSLIYQRLQRYWQGGQTPNVFVPLSHLRGKTDEISQ